MINFLISLGLFSLFFVFSVAIDPVSPTLVETGVIASRVIINDTQRIGSIRNLPELQTPFNFTSVVDTFYTVVNTNKSTYGFYSISSNSIMILGLIFQAANNSSIVVPTLGPCAGNALTHKDNPIWSVFDFSLSNPMGDTQITFTISRIYQDAFLSINVPQWIVFHSTHSHYAVSNPNSHNEILQFDIRRHNSSAPPPWEFFSLIILATEEQCLNPSSDNRNKPGVIESFNISTGNNTNPDLFSYVFSTIISPNSMVYVTLHPKRDFPTGFDFTYSINVSSLSSPTPPPPLKDTIGIIIGIACTSVFLICAGLSFWIYQYKKGHSYKPLK